MTEPQPRRRASDYEEGFAAVSLRDHLEGQIKASVDALQQEITYVRAEVAAGQLQSTREHAAVQHDLGELKAAVAALRSIEEREEAGAAVRRSIRRTGFALAGTLSAVIGAAAAILALLH